MVSLLPVMNEHPDGPFSWLDTGVEVSELISWGSGRKTIYPGGSNEKTLIKELTEMWAGLRE